MDCCYRGKTWEEFEIGETHSTAGRTITEADTVQFACLTGDMNPLHTDAEFASRSPYGKRIAHGAFGQALMVGLTAPLGLFEGTTLALRHMDTRFKHPIYFGDTIHVVLRVDGKKELKGMEQGLVTFKAKLYNQDDKVVIDSTWTVLFKKSD
jgi:3-hydroxybutyryl-CoA dehydratase